MRLKDEYLINQNKLSEFKNYTYLFSYPFGQPKKCYDDNTNQVLFDLGAKKLFTAVLQQRVTSASASEE